MKKEAIGRMGGGYGDGAGKKATERECSYASQWSDEQGTNHMMCPFLHQCGKCRHVHIDLEAHTGPEGVAMTEDEYEAVKQQCITTFNWQEAVVPRFPSAKRGGSKGEGKGKGKGKGKGEGKSKGKGGY